MPIMSHHDTADNFARTIFRDEGCGSTPLKGKMVVRLRIVVADGEIAGFPEIDNLLLVASCAFPDGK